MMRLSILCCVILLLNGCASESASVSPEVAIENLKLLHGKWKVNGAEEYEEWTATTKFPISGKVYSGDGIKKDELSIEQVGPDIIYKAKVFGQGGGKVLGFKMIQCSNSEVTFQNKNHDFPNTITYKRVTEDLLEGIVSGARDGQPIELKLKFERVK